MGATGGSAEADSELQELWQRVYRVLDTSNKEHAKWERYSREQCGLLRALEDLAAQERTMYELDNRKGRPMTVFKLALTNLVIWVRDQYFPPTYAHATWTRLAPFFHLPGVVTSSQQTVSVELHPFNDRQYNRDLILLCQRVNEKHLHLLFLPPFSPELQPCEHLWPETSEGVANRSFRTLALVGDGPSGTLCPGSRTNPMSSAQPPTFDFRPPSHSNHH